MRVLQLLLIACLCCLSLAACTTTDGEAVAASNDGMSALAMADPTEIPPPGTGDTRLVGNNPNDDVSLGKKYFREGQFGTAEKYFQRAVEANPRSAEGWLGLAASYDRLRRFDLADRAYDQTIRLAGPTAEVLNNQGYSHLLRGDYATARAKFEAARALAPNNPQIAANLRLLSASAETRRPVQ